MHVVPKDQVITTDSIINNDYHVLDHPSQCSACIHGMKFNSFMQGPKAYMLQSWQLPTGCMHGPLILNPRCFVEF